jgi:hypothetical protein
MPADGARPTLKWGRGITETVAGSSLTSPDHLIQETPGGTMIKHKTPYGRAGAAEETTLPFVFIFKQTSSTGGDWVPGRFYSGGTSVAIVSQPTTLSDITTSRVYWLLHDFAAGTVTWQTGTEYPAASDTQEIYRMLEVTCASDAIASFICPHPCDIHATSKST